DARSVRAREAGPGDGRRRAWSHSGRARGPAISSGRSPLFRELQRNIGPGAHPHQPKQRGAEFRHGEIVVDLRDKHDAQREGPHDHLKAVETVTLALGVVFVSKVYNNLT